MCGSQLGQITSNAGLHRYCTKVSMDDYDMAFSDHKNLALELPPESEQHTDTKVLWTPAGGGGSARLRLTNAVAHECDAIGAYSSDLKEAALFAWQHRGLSN